MGFRHRPANNDATQMDATQRAGHAPAHDAPAHAHGHEHHHEPNFFQKYIFSTDHKVIGIQYGVMALLFLLLGFMLIAAMRWSIAEGSKQVRDPNYKVKPIPVMGALLEKALGSDAVK